MATEVRLEGKKKRERGTCEQLRWRNGIGTSDWRRKAPHCHMVQSIELNEAWGHPLHRGTDQSHHTSMNNLIWAFNRGICQQLVIAELLLLKTKKKELFTWRVPKSNTWQWADKYSSRKRNQQGIWSLNCCHEKNSKTISAMWYRLYSFGLGSRAKICGWRM